MKIKLSELKKIIKKELNEQKQTMDLRSLQIHCKYIKSELDAVVEWYQKRNLQNKKEVGKRGIQRTKRSEKN